MGLRNSAGCFDGTSSGSLALRSRVTFAFLGVDIANGRGKAPAPIGKAPAPTSQGGIVFVDFPENVDPRNKVGNLFLRDGLSIIAGTAVGGNPPPADQSLADGDPVPLLYPGMVNDGTATADVSVSGQLLTPGGAVRSRAFGHAARARRIRATLPFVGRAEARGHRPYVLTLRPTAAGRTALRQAHRAIKATARVRFKPRKGRTLTVALTIHLPATGR